MRVFIDESGSFDWERPGLSIVAAVAIAETDDGLSRASKRLRLWERSLPRARRKGGETKGHLLTDDELTTFVDRVVSDRRDEMHVTLCGFDSSKKSRAQVARFRDRVGVLATPAMAKDHLRALAR